MSNIWVTGYRSFELGIFKDDDLKNQVLKDYIKEQLIISNEDGYEWVLVGGQMGIEQLTIQAANELKADEYNLKVACILPYQNFEKNWNEKNQEKFFLALQSCDYSTYLSEKDYQSPKQLFNWQNFMLDHTQGSFIIYDEEKEGKPKYDFKAMKKYSENNEYQLNQKDFYDLEDFSNNWQENNSNE